MRKGQIVDNLLEPEVIEKSDAVSSDEYSEQREGIFRVLQNPIVWEVSRIGLDLTFGLYRTRSKTMRSWGLLDDDPGIRLADHIHVNSKAAWEILDAETRQRGEGFDLG